jgi:nicotinate-nucleotide--dimethylbenzimidazole phosphoribosyltransferase
MKNWRDESLRIPQPDAAWAQKARQRLNEQTRPQGSLGLLEGILERLAAIQKKERLDIGKKRILIFAADHGVAEENVSLYPKEVTQAMVLNFLSGGATINALARHLGAEVQVVDMGVAGDFEKAPGLLQHKIARGTKNMVQEPAMTVLELERALQTGWNLAEDAVRDGIQILALGEMGIGNTTAATAVIAALAGVPPALITGRGTGLDEPMRLHKAAVIEKALKRHQPLLGDPLKIMQCVGGYEIAAMMGAILSAARAELPVIIDGWIVSAAALAAVEWNAKSLDYLFFAHESAEQGHRFLLERFDVRPLLDLSMRLGEASGAALALNLLQAAVHIYNETATFEEAGVSKRVR